MDKIKEIHFALPFTRDGILCWTLAFSSAEDNKILVSLAWQDKDRATYTTTVSRAEMLKMINTLAPERKGK